MLCDFEVSNKLCYQPACLCRLKSDLQKKVGQVWLHLPAESMIAHSQMQKQPPYHEGLVPPGQDSNAGSRRLTCWPVGLLVTFKRSFKFPVTKATCKCESVSPMWIAQTYCRAMTTF